MFHLELSEVESSGDVHSASRWQDLVTSIQGVNLSLN